MTRITCPLCSAGLTLNALPMPGKRIQCPKCQQEFQHQLGVTETAVRAVDGSPARRSMFMPMMLGGIMLFLGMLVAGGNYLNRLIHLLGDADGDHDVDELDWGHFRDASKSLLGEARYRWYFDFDGDGRIDQSDRRWLKHRASRPRPSVAASAP